MTPAMAETKIHREEIESAIAARRELGEEMEPAVVDAFVERVEQAIEARAAEEARRGRMRGSDEGIDFALAVISLGTGIPITAIAADAGGVQGMIVAWLGIVGVNFAHRFKR
jgi:hypothetical protein